MVDVEKMKNEYQHTNPVGQFRSSVGKLSCDLLELVELQGKLFKAEAQLAMERSIGTAIVALIGSCFLLGCLPVFILGMASAVSFFFEIESWIAQLAVSFVFSFIGIAVLAVSLKRFAKTGFQFQRSMNEFSKNVEWVKDIVNGVSSK